MTASRKTILFHPSLIRALAIGLSLLAMVSAGYAVITAPSEGKDLATFQEMGIAWANGIYQSRQGIFYGPPPYTSVLFYPLSLASFEYLRVIFLALNLICAAATVYLALKLWGKHWPMDAKIILAAIFLSLAPFRVTLRVGQISLIATALLLGALLARCEGRKLVAGLLLGLSLSKYPLTLPFFLYFAWRKEWKAIAIAILVVATLTIVFSLRLGVSPVEVTTDYIYSITSRDLSNDQHFHGTTEIGALLFTLTGGDAALANRLNIALALAGIAAMFFVFHRRPREENLHLAALTFYSLWFVYHRTYDSVLLIVPAAIFVDYILRKERVAFNVAALAILGLFIVSIPGLLTERLHLNPDDLMRNAAGLLGLHIERLAVISLFCGALILLWKSRPEDKKLQTS